MGDSDSDGINDNDDDCPNTFGPQDNDGCPYPDDPDRDNIRGNKDKCPNEYAPGTNNDCLHPDNYTLDTS